MTSAAILLTSLANSMDILAERLEDARRRDEQLHSQQQAFFSNISHELKTPVTIIRASLEALHDGVIRGEENIQTYYAQMLLADPSFSTVLLLPENSKVYTDDPAMQLMQNAGRKHLMMEDTYDAVWSDALMPLEQLMQPESGTYMAVIDRSELMIGECFSSGLVATSFGSVALHENTGTVTITGPNRSFTLSMQPEPDVYAVVLDKESGDVLYDRTLRL